MDGFNFPFNCTHLQKEEILRRAYFLGVLKTCWKDVLEAKNAITVAPRARPVAGLALVQAKPDKRSGGPFEAPTGGAQGERRYATSGML